MLSKTHIAYAEDQTMRTIKGTIALEDGATITTSAPLQNSGVLTCSAGVPREQLDLKYPFMFLLKPSKSTRIPLTCLTIPSAAAAKTIFLLASDSLEDMLAWTAAFHRNIVQIPVWRSEQVSGSVPAAAKGKVVCDEPLARGLSFYDATGRYPRPCWRQDQERQFAFCSNERMPLL